MLTLHIDSDSSRHVPFHCLLGLLLYNKYDTHYHVHRFQGYHCWVFFGVLFVSEKALLCSQGWACTHDLPTSSAEYQELLICVATSNSSTWLSAGQGIIDSLSFFLFFWLSFLMGGSAYS